MNVISQFEKFNLENPAEAPVMALRAKAFEQSQHLGLPTRKSEDWKYTSLKDLSEIRWLPASHAQAQVSAKVLHEIKASLSSESLNLVFIDGSLNETLSTSSKELSENKIKLSVHNDFEARSLDNIFEQLIGVYFQRRYSLAVPQETKVEKVIHIIHATTQNHLLVQAHVSIEIGARSKASVVESFVSLESSTDVAFSNSLTRVKLAKNSSLGFLRIQNQNDFSFNIGQTEIIQEGQSELEVLSLSMGAALSKHMLTVLLKESGATSQVMGAYVGRKNQHHDLQTNIQHLVGECTTHQLYKGLLDGKSRAVFNGKVCIAQNAQKAFSEQLNNNLLLSSNAEADSKPQLEILADDVKATHGSTVGQLDSEELFYLLSRAIPRSTAIQMLSFGFVAEAVEKITDARLKKEALKNLSVVFRKLESVQK